MGLQNGQLIDPKLEPAKKRQTSEVRGTIADKSQKGVMLCIKGSINLHFTRKLLVARCLTSSMLLVRHLEATSSS